MSARSGEIRALRQRAAAQVEALQGLAGLFDEEAELLHRKRQVQTLQLLRKRVSSEVSALQGAELASYHRFSDGRLINAGLNFAVGGLVSAMTGLGKRPLVVGLRCAEQALAEKQPFGNVQVAVGPGGVPGDVSVVCISRFARDGGISESRAEAALRAEGRVLMSPDEFSWVLDKLEPMVLAGTLALPVAATQLPQRHTQLGRTTP